MKLPVFGRIAPLVAFALVCVSLGGGVAHAAPEASIVMDMRNGKVLRSRSADRKLHPASLTKMMTLYVTFEAIKNGRIRLDQRVRVSRHAARQPASKLYLKAGQRVTIRSLIRATAIKSANDAAMVLAEAVGGSQKRFAQMMNESAKRLGMKNSRFRNPHGLTQSGHYSTARDMAILGRHLFFDYPQYYNIFKRKSDHAAGRRIWNTNRLLSTYRGADGIKTGYTRAAGYNLVATANRGNKRVLAVLFGGRSSGDRARKVARLLDIGFSRSRNSVKRVRPQKVETRVASTGRKGKGAVRRSPVPRIRPGTDIAAAVAAVLASPANASTPANLKVTRTSAPLVADLPVPRGGTAITARILLLEPVQSPTTVTGALARVPVPRPRPVRLAARGDRV
ncbi:MAG: D-alanyl-D-alanine carboxypeptidase family protein [Pseudomonadota bacterium]